MSYLYAALATAGLVVYLARLARLLRSGRSGRSGEPPRSHVSELDPMDRRLGRT
jgi:hypothetical protein